MNDFITVKIQGKNNTTYNLSLTPPIHSLIFGIIGSGKSNLLHLIITDIIKKYSPDKIKLALIDPKCVEFDCYKNIPHLFGKIANTQEEISQLLKNCTKEQTTPILIVIDELAELTMNKEIISIIESIICDESNKNLSIFMATQSPDLVSEKIIKNTKSKFCFKIYKNKLNTNLLPSLTTETIVSPGEVIIPHANNNTYFQTEYISPSQIQKIANDAK